MKDDFHDAAIGVSSGMLIIPVVLGLVFTLIILTIPMITIAKIGAILGLIGFCFLFFILGVLK